MSEGRKRGLNGGVDHAAVWIYSSHVLEFNVILQVLFHDACDRRRAGLYQEGRDLVLQIYSGETIFIRSVQPLYVIRVTGEDWPQTMRFLGSIFYFPPIPLMYIYWDGFLKISHTSLAHFINDF